MSKGVAALRRLGTRRRGVEDSVSYAVGHRVRIEILAALHEGPASAAQLAKIVRQSLSTVGYHLEELLKDGSIAVIRAALDDKSRRDQARGYLAELGAPVP